MNLINLTFAILAIGFLSCKSKKQSSNMTDTSPDIKIVGEMKNVMWKGELDGRINLDTISDRKGLYGLGPESYLAGELMLNNGVSYISKATSDSTMRVEKRFDVSAPFFVYANIKEWDELEIPANIKSIKDLEKLIDEKTREYERPFAFKLQGKVSKALIHIQNLPKGAKVSSPEEAHRGQVNYEINDEEVEIIGFFSTKHQGIFTHHDSFLHMHLITKDESKMGHLDELEISKMTLFLPKNKKSIR